MTEGLFKSVRTSIIRWFQQAGRDFPWRSIQDPFHILIAEMFLRRTTAKAVSSVYPSFIKRYSTPEKLARARIKTLEKFLEPLGLQSIRAQHMHETARILVKKHNSQVPASQEELEELPGVGRYVASATLNLAFERPVPMVDGNVVHLINRIFAMEFSSPEDSDVWAFMESFGGTEHNKRLYWGIIDLVATTCLRKKPRCEKCPVTERCNYNREVASNQES
ncbi:MAG: hypothetical protein RTU92_12720 [Candidatus Thorarchaeota archaeon]